MLDSSELQIGSWVGAGTFGARYEGIYEGSKVAVRKFFESNARALAPTRLLPTVAAHCSCPRGGLPSWWAALVVGCPRGELRGTGVRKRSATARFSAASECDRARRSRSNGHAADYRVRSWRLTQGSTLSGPVHVLPAVGYAASGGRDEAPALA